MGAHTVDQWLDDQSRWSRTPYILKLGEKFETYKDVTTFIHENDEGKAGDVKGYFKAALPEHLTKHNVSDSSIGGNDAINAYPQYCENDDIVHPLTAINGNPSLGGMGRVYSETINRHQQIMWLAAGGVEFTGLSHFYANAISTDMSNLVNNGDETVAHKLGNLVGTTLKIALFLPLLPLKFLFVDLPSALTGNSLGKYYDFKPMMPLYYRYVNSILSHLAGNMGLLPTPKKPGGSTEADSNAHTETIYRKLFSDSKDAKEEDGLPDILKNGPNMWKILSKRDYRLRKNNWCIDSDAALKGEKAPPGFWNSFGQRVIETATGADAYIGVRIDKNVSCSESVSNEAGESGIASTLNSTAASARDTMFGIQNGTTNIVGVDGAIKALKDFTKAAVDKVTFGVGSFAETIATGSGYIDIPEVWKNSSFSKSYTFSTELIATYGDPVSIFQDIYVPLACMLPFVLPRSIGPNAYTSPFLIRAYCKGMFAIPLGLIDSMTIERGGSEHGWNVDMLPTRVNVSFTIRDLSPVMHMPLADSIADAIFGQNSSFQEYLLTLSGIGLAERTQFYHRLNRNLGIAWNMLRSTYLSRYYWASMIGSTDVSRLVGAITPYRNQYNGK